MGVTESPSPFRIRPLPSTSAADVHGAWALPPGADSWGAGGPDGRWGQLGSHPHWALRPLGQRCPCRCRPRPVRPGKAPAELPGHRPHFGLLYALEQGWKWEKSQLWPLHRFTTFFYRIYWVTLVNKMNRFQEYSSGTHRLCMDCAHRPVSWGHPLSLTPLPLLLSVWACL